MKNIKEFINESLISDFKKNKRLALKNVKNNLLKYFTNDYYDFIKLPAIVVSSYNLTDQNKNVQNELNQCNEYKNKIVDDIVNALKEPIKVNPIKEKPSKIKNPILITDHVVFNLDMDFTMDEFNKICDNIKHRLSSKFSEITKIEVGHPVYASKLRDDIMEIEIEIQVNGYPQYIDIKYLY
jgi:hypothetical protein